MSQIKFCINGKQYGVDCKFGPDVSLNEYIRTVAELRGTKAMCNEGGCGACIVAVRAAFPPDNVRKIFAVNSCLVSVLSCHGWEVTTVEGIGNRIKGYHDIQTRLAQFNGTQCGYCTPGWIMNMYSLYESKGGHLTGEEVENSFASNMCRCTGYRPIAEAFKSFAKDADKKLLDKLCDLEELNMIKACGLDCSQKCTHRDNCFKENADTDNGTEMYARKDADEDDNGFIHIHDDERTIMVETQTHKWHRVYNLTDVFKAMSLGNYKLIAGNTGQGVYRESDYPTNVIDIFNVAELKGYTLDVNLILGAGMTLSDMMELSLKLSAEKEEFSYLKQFYDHMDLVAHIPVRNPTYGCAKWNTLGVLRLGGLRLGVLHGIPLPDNLWMVGTIGGNLFLKHSHNEFQSDVFLLFETVGAMVTIAQDINREVKLKLPEFLKTQMCGKIIKNVMLPPLSKNACVKTFKIMSRAQNAHAVVHAGFLFEFRQNSNFIERCSIVYGAISPTFIHASKTENVLVGKDPYTDKTLQLALKFLYAEINPVEMPPEPSAAYRRMLAVSLYYKAILSLCPINLMNPSFKSGGEALKRQKSKGMQSFETDRSVWPLNQPVPKVEALVQCSGEATFANDMPAQANEVFAAFVTADAVPGSVINDFDTTEAFELPGVIAFYAAKDIPGVNSFIPENYYGFPEKEELLCDKHVKFYGQPAAIIVADREQTANKAASLVKIRYSSISQNRPLLTIDQVLKSPERNKRVKAVLTVEPTEIGHDVKTVISGEIQLDEQYHYHMETQTCVARPTEDGMDVFSSTQWLDFTNVAIAEVLKVPVNSINVIVRRLGGGFGAKLTRPSQVACSAALVTHLLNRTCRMIMPLPTNMHAMGKRVPVKCNFEVGVNEDGEIQHLKNIFYEDAGFSYNELFTNVTVAFLPNCYNSKRWYISSSNVLTDKACTLACRAPWSTEAIAMTEYMLEKIAFNLKRDPIEVRLLNMVKENNPIPEMINQLKQDANFEHRETQIKEFNKNNRWRKRAMKLVPLKFFIAYGGNFNAIVSIYHKDGSVMVTHGGIEMGQGINTKTAQVCAYVLGIPLEKISVKPSTSFSSPNAFLTGSSSTSEAVVLATKRACEIINERLQPIRDRMKNPSWEDMTVEAYNSAVNLQASYMFDPNEAKPYDVYAVSIMEVEVDILSGNHYVKRFDVLQDTGRSLSPEIDIGQIEGALIMGLGYWTVEKTVYDDSTGKLLTNRTWNYKIPGIKDIPSDMRIYLRRNAKNEFGVLHSKATGEPSVCLATVFLHAAREAVRSARLDAGYEDEWLDIDIPCTMENIFMAAGHKLKHFTLN